MNEPKDKANETELQNKSKTKESLQKPESYATIEDFPESTHRARRNLLIFAIIALFYKLSGATPTEKISFLGLELENIDSKMIEIFLFLIVFYHLIHFAWLALEHWKKNQIMLTRMVEKDKRGGLGTIDLEDWGWNLYSWWKKIGQDVLQKFPNYQKVVSEYTSCEKEDEDIKVIKKSVESIHSCMESHRNKITERDELSKFDNAMSNFNLIVQNQTHFLQKRKQLISASEALEKGVKSLQITLRSYFKTSVPALQKFDKSYKNYSTSTRWRWWGLETGLPAALGLLAMLSFEPHCLNFLKNFL